VIAAFAVLIALSAALGLTSSRAATGTTVVTASVLGATTLNTASCAPGTANVTAFGSLAVGDERVLPGCTVTFGSSNSTGSLRVQQVDRGGVAMYQMSRGVVDTGFGTLGGMSAPWSPGALSDTVDDATVLPDGRIVLAGHCKYATDNDNDTCLMRLTAAGALDATFAGDGTLQLPMLSGSRLDRAHAVALLDDGDLVVAGECEAVVGNGDGCVARINTDGTLDTAFGASGVVVQNDAFNSRNYWDAVLVDTIGRLVLVGRCQGPVDVDFCASRLQSDGALDTSYGVNGWARINTATGPGNFDQARAGALAADGKLLIGGECDSGGVTGNDMCVARLNVDGSPDTTFDGDGWARFATALAGGTDFVNAIDVDNAGRIIAAGVCRNGATGDDVCVRRITAAGAADPSFGTGGVVTSNLSGANRNDGANDVYVQPDDKVVIASDCNDGAAFLACVARYTTGGVLDASFAGSGVLNITSALLSSLSGTAVVPALDGSFVVAGSCWGGATTQDGCAVRLSGGAAVHQYDDDGGRDWDTAGTATGLFGACLASTTSATPAWTVNASCPATDGVYWNPIPAAVASTVATANPFTATATANVRFGVRIADGYASGDYVAPVRFSVVAP
jgi:uncharacterized delta-60 repeat protein